MITSGIDVGSAAIKVAVVDTDGEGGERLLAGVTERVRRRDSLAVVETAYQAALDGARVTRSDVGYVATTGEGESVPFRTGHFYGMTTHARGGLFLDAASRGVVDIGALHVPNGCLENAVTQESSPRRRMNWALPIRQRDGSGTLTEMDRPWQSFRARSSFKWVRLITNSKKVTTSGSIRVGLNERLPLPRPK